MTLAEIDALVRSARSWRKDCSRLVNGLHAIQGHCYHCDALINASRPIEYHIRDNHGNVITADWINSEL